MSSSGATPTSSARSYALTTKRARTSSFMPPPRSASSFLRKASVCRNRRVLGQGAFGLVCSRNNRAVKVQPKCKTDDVWCRTQNKKELEFFRRVAKHHPNYFMQLFGSETRGPFYVLTLEKMDGTYWNSKDENEPMRRTQSFFEKHPLAINSFFLQLFSGLNFMRARGYNHTDLHQGNIAYVNTKEKYMTVSPFFGDGTVAGIKQAGRGLEIPTFGRKWKIIDYGLVTKSSVSNVDERQLFLRFLMSWRRDIVQDSDDTPPDSADEYPQIDIDLARSLEPQRVAFIESFAPPSIMRVGINSMFPESDFGTAYELVFGTDEYFDLLLHQHSPAERRRWKYWLGRQESLVSVEELVFFYQARTKIDDVVVPRLIGKLLLPS